MKSRDVEALVAYRMERSNESIEAAKIMVENNMFTFSMNRRPHSRISFFS